MHFLSQISPLKPSEQTHLKVKYRKLFNELLFKKKEKKYIPATNKLAIFAECDMITI